MFESLWKRILRRKHLSVLAIPALFLWLASFLYRILFILYRATRGQPLKLQTPVVSVGSILMGGAGKTPITEAVAQELMAEGQRIGIVSSGYGRSSRDSIMLPGYKMKNLDASLIGDEVCLMAQHLPEVLFSVDRSKTTAAAKLDASGEVDVIIVDDGFQHYTLARDLEIVAYDAAQKPRVLKTFPYGVLREPLSAMSRANIIIITRAKFARDIAKLRRRLAEISPQADIYHAGFVSDALIAGETSLPIKYIEDKSVFLFAGVGNFRSLRIQVAALAGDLDYAFELSDHQVYDEQLLSRIKTMADDFNSDLILTTCKDWVKLGSFDFGREVYYLSLSIDLDPGEEKLTQKIMRRLNLQRGKY